MSTKEERNMETVRNAIQALNDRNVDLFLSFFTGDGTSHEVFFPEPLTLEQFKPFLVDWLNAYPDAKIDTQDIVAEGDTVAVENIVSGTFENDLSGDRATGKFYTTREAVFFDMEDGKIKAERIYIDQKHISEQLGI